VLSAADPLDPREAASRERRRYDWLQISSWLEVAKASVVEQLQQTPLYGDIGRELLDKAMRAQNIYECSRCHTPTPGAWVVNKVGWCRECRGMCGVCRAAMLPMPTLETTQSDAPWPDLVSIVATRCIHHH
jgi:hypothetical protein